MGYLVGAAAGLFVVALVLAAGATGYAIAHAPRNRPALIAMTAGSVAILGVAGSILGAATYSRLSGPAVVETSNHVSPVTSPAGATPSSAPISVTDAWMHFQSDAGDYIGGGTQKVWTLTESNFGVDGTNGDLHASVSGRGDWWDLEFRAPSNGTLQVGRFANAERAPFVTGKAPGLDVNGDGRGCNTLTGTFEIKSIAWTSDATVSQLDVLFEQHCEGGAPALRGELWLTSKPGIHKQAPSAASSVVL